MILPPAGTSSPIFGIRHGWPDGGQCRDGGRLVAVTRRGSMRIRKRADYSRNRSEPMTGAMRGKTPPPTHPVRYVQALMPRHFRRDRSGREGLCGTWTSRPKGVALRNTAFACTRYFETGHVGQRRSDETCTSGAIRRKNTHRHDIQLGAPFR